MIEIKRKNLEPLVFEDAATIKEAVEYAVSHYICMGGVYLRGADLSGVNLSYTDLSWADLSCADLSGADLSGVILFHADLRKADLSGADLLGADLRCADLTDAQLLGADLSGADIDFSCLPLWCGSLNMKIDKKIFCQLLYHIIRAGKSVEDEEVVAFLSDPKALALANQFHRVKECGKITGEIQ